MEAQHGVLINEARTNAVCTGSDMLTTYLMRRPHIVLQATIGGALVWVPCNDEQSAADLHGLLASFGLPAAGFTIAHTDDQGRVPTRLLAKVGNLKAAKPIAIADGWTIP